MCFLLRAPLRHRSAPSWSIVSIRLRCAMTTKMPSGFEVLRAAALLPAGALVAAGAESELDDEGSVVESDVAVSLANVDP